MAAAMMGIATCFLRVRKSGVYKSHASLSNAPNCFCCRTSGSGDQALQDGGGLLVFGAPRPEGQHGEGSAHHGLQEHRRPSGAAWRSPAEWSVSSRAGWEGPSLFSSPACPLLFLLILLFPSCACRFLSSTSDAFLFAISSHPQLFFSASSPPVDLLEPKSHLKSYTTPPQGGEN